MKEIIMKIFPRSMLKSITGITNKTAANIINSIIFPMFFITTKGFSFNNKANIPASPLIIFPSTPPLCIKYSMDTEQKLKTKI